MTTLTLLEPDLRSLEAQVDEANRLFSEGDEEGALTLLAPLTSDEHAFLPARFLLAMASWKIGRLDSAIEIMRDCHEKWPMEGTVAETLATLQAQAGNFEEGLFMAKLATALGSEGKLSKLIPKRFPIFDAIFYNFREKPLLMQARTSLAQGNVPLAIEYVRQHSALNPSDGDSHVLLASSLFRVGMASTANEVMSSVVAKMADGGDLPASYASLYARVETAVGRFDEARDLHDKAVAQAPEDASIAAARIADGLWLGVGSTELAAWGKEWARRFCVAPKPRHWSRVEGKLVVGYIVSAFLDPLDIAAVAAAARAHDRGRVTVVGYGAGAQSWNENGLLSGAFDKWQDVSALDPATLARFFSRAGLHLVIDAAGFAAPNCLMALARLQTALRVSWLGNPAGVGAPVYDAEIGTGSSETTGATAWRIGAGYPLLPVPQGATARAARDGINFGADARMAQLDSETIELWSTVLRAQPNSKLVLRSRDMAQGANIDRLVARFGRELAARIDLIEVKGAENFYAAIDVALMPCRGVSPRAAAEALMGGAPPVALAGTDAAGPYAGFLREIGLGAHLVAASARDYVNVAVNLAASEASRAGAVAAMATAKAGAMADDFARALEERAIEALAATEGLCA